MINVLSIDPGFSDVKVIALDENGDLAVRFKFISAVANAPELSSGLSDPRIIRHDDNTFYTGQLAVKQPSGSIFDLKSFSKLQYFTPVLIRHVIRELEIEDQPPKVLSMQISIAHLKHTASYKAMLVEFLESIGWSDTQITLVPQGIASKVAIDKYGATFPEVDPTQISRKDYLAVDIGFNTADVVSVIDGKASAAAVRGLEGEGIIKIAYKVSGLVKEQFNKDISLKEAKEIIGSGFLKIRGKRNDLTKEIGVFKTEYLKDLEILLENEFGSVLDKSDRLFIVGGGAYFFEDLHDEFMETCNEPEYYNAIGGSIAGQKLV